MGHPRFKTLSRNIRMRRGEKVIINVPVYPDDNTPKGHLEDLSKYGDDGTSHAVSLPGKESVLRYVYASTYLSCLYQATFTWMRWASAWGCPAFR